MDNQIIKKYNYWQWRTLIILMIGYALFYFVRKNFSIVMPALESELGISKVQLGLFLTINGIIYGVSRFINGFLVDRIRHKRVMMAIGLTGSAIVTILIGLSPQMNAVFHFLDETGKATTGLIYYIGSLWLINGYMQGMGYPPCCTLMAHWIKPSELATKQSIWNSSHSIGAGLVALLCGTVILHYFGYEAWQWCFFIPAILALLGALLIITGLKDDPSDVGLPDPESLDEHKEQDGQAEAHKKDTAFQHRVYKKMVSKMVFKNPILWILAFTNFFVYIIRFTILDWGSTFLTQFKGLSIQTASTTVAASEIVGGIIGTLLAGWATDKFFKSKAHRTSLIGLIPGDQEGGRFRKRSRRHTGLPEHDRLGPALRCPCAELWMGLCIPRVPDLRTRGRSYPRPYVEGSGGRLREGREDPQGSPRRSPGRDQGRESRGLMSSGKSR